MATRAFGCVQDLRPPLVATAAAHPLNSVPLASLTLLLLLTGVIGGAVAVVFFDMLLVALALRMSRVRERLARRSIAKARQRAVDQLEPAAQGEWHSLLALTQRSQSFGATDGRRDEVDTLLNTFLNVALAEARARRCVGEPSVDTVRVPRDPAVEVLRRQRAEARRRSERALEALRQQLDVTAELIRLECEGAAADECEGAADLWLGDVRDSCSHKRLAADSEVIEPATVEAPGANI